MYVLQVTVHIFNFKPNFQRRAKPLASPLTDAYGVHEMYARSVDPVLRGGTQVRYLDPSVMVAAMAEVTV